METKNELDDGSDECGMNEEKKEAETGAGIVKRTNSVSEADRDYLPHHGICHAIMEGDKANSSSNFFAATGVRLSVAISETWTCYHRR